MYERTDARTADFRHDAAAWIAANLPDSLKGKEATRYFTDGAYADADADYQLWLRRVIDHGWGAPSWPVAYGGGGLGEDEAAIISEELARAGAFNPNRTYGVWMLGPTLFEFATEEQKQRFLPPIARGEVRWCQGFSEPGAGSDLASLQTRCVDAGDHWLVNGQKIWTSGANFSDWCFCLVRTDTSVKHLGISFLLIDMRTPGIEARPIHLIDGTTHFCEVFFNDVRVPKDNMIGPVNGGWAVAKRLLQFERGGLASGRGEPESLAALARARVGVDAEGAIADRDLRARLVENEMRGRAYRLTLQRSAEAAVGNGATVPISILKNLGSSISQKRAELVLEIVGQDGLGWDGAGYCEEDLAASHAWLHSKAYSIYGGSFEVQHNITAKRVLGLPSQI